MNPVAYARFLEGISASKLSKEIGVSKQYISRLEQGLYDNPNGKVMRWAAEVLDKNSSDETEVNQSIVTIMYNEWQWEERNKLKEDLGLQPVTLDRYEIVSEAALTGSPNIVYYHRVFSNWLHVYWRSPHEFCVAMKLHPSPVDEYIGGGTYKMPGQLKAVLSRLGLLGKGFKTNER